MNENAQLAEFANNLWNNFLKRKAEQQNMDAVSYYRAEVTANNGNRRVTVQRPLDNAIVVSTTPPMANVSVGDQVIVARFGKGNNNANHLVIAYSDGDAGYSTVATTGSYNDLADVPTLPDGLDYATFAIANNATGTYQVTTTTHALIVITAPTSGARGMYLLYIRTNGTFGLTNILSGSVTPTASATNGRFTVTNSSGYAVDMRCLIFTGGITQVTT